MIDFLVSEFQTIDWTIFGPALIWLLGILPAYHFLVSCVELARPDYNKSAPIDRQVSFEEAGLISAMFAVIWPITLLIVIYWIVTGFFKRAA